MCLMGKQLLLITYMAFKSGKFKIDLNLPTAVCTCLFVLQINTGLVHLYTNLVTMISQQPLLQISIDK